MNRVEAFEGKNVIFEMGQVIKAKPKTGERNYLLFMTGLYLGRRISDILPLRVIDVRDKSVIKFKEKKTRKTSELVINKDLQRLFSSYCKGKKDYEYLFRNSRGKANKPISRIQYWKILNEAADKIGIDYNIGCHSLRKSLGKHLYYDMKVPIETIMMILNHSDIESTKVYIGITQKEIDNILNKVHFL